MTVASPRPLRPWSGLGLALLLALLSLAGNLGWVWREVELILPNDRIAASLSVDTGIGATLGLQLSGFGAALLLSHVMLGLLAFALARLTETAFPSEHPVAGRGWLIAGWFVGLTGLTMAANTTWHPASVFSGDESWWRGELLGLRPVVSLAALLLVLILWLLMRAAARLRPRIPVPARVLAGIAIFAVAASVALPKILNAARPPAAGRLPNVVIIGIDSLRHDLTLPRLGNAATPHIDQFLAGSHRFSDATSPLARTYGAWVSILTGRHPVTTNARVNLMPRAQVREGETLADVLHARGYHTVYATDEVRFANFDESFGFDQLITPPVGAIDFVLGYAGDQPLVNLIVSTVAGRWLFPSNHANRAAYVTYRPAQFTGRLRNELSAQNPQFIAIHLTLAHWPYAWAGQSLPRTPPDYRRSYAASIAAVDQQFADVMRILAEQHVLDNAIVVVLSDHGEALGGDSDSMLRETGTHREVWDSLWGHGTSVMSPHQYQVLLAMRGYGRARLPGKPRSYDWPVSLEDLRPTLEHYATGVAPQDVDGLSLLPYLSDPALAAQLVPRIRFTETDFNTPSTLAGRYEASGIIDEAAVFYELEPASGWVQFRSDKLPDMLARKQRAALSKDALLASIPSWTDDSVTWLYTERRAPLPRRLTGRPDPGTEPEAARLWDALHARFAGELPPQADLP